MQFESACLLHFLTSRIKFFAHSHIEQPKKRIQMKVVCQTTPCRTHLKKYVTKTKFKKTFAGSFTLSMIQLVYPTKFNISIVFAFSWDECNTQEKLKTVLIKKKLEVNKLVNFPPAWQKSMRTSSIFSRN